MKKNQTHHLDRIGSQWNLGRKMHSWPASQITLSSTEIWLVKSSCLLRMRAMQQLLFSNGQTGAHLARRWPTLKPCSSRVCWSPFSPQIPSSSFGFCHSILEMGWILEWWCPFAFAVLLHLIYSSQRLWVHWALMQHEQMIDQNKKGLASGVLIMWEESVVNFGWFLRPEMSHLGFFFWRHCGYEVFWIQIKYFIVSLLHDEKIWEVVNMLSLSKGSDC